MTSEFTKHWDLLNGYTYAEAIAKKEAVDEAHGVGTENSKWNAAKIVPDPNKKTGYKVVISTK